MVMEQTGITWIIPKYLNSNMNRANLLQEIKSKLQTVDCAIEVGVWRGEFSVQMINALQPTQFYGVDPYCYAPDQVSAPGPEFANQAKLDKLANTVSSHLQSRGGELLRAPSVTAAKQFKGRTVDVVYLDGDHTYAGVARDIKAWLPKVKVGGYLCGHDYCEGTTGGGYPYGTIQAVFEAFPDTEVGVTTDNPPSWYIRKT